MGLQRLESGTGGRLLRERHAVRPANLPGFESTRFRLPEFAASFAAHGSAPPIFRVPLAVDIDPPRLFAHPACLSFAESLQAVWRWLRAKPPGWREQAREVRLVDAIAAEIEEAEAADRGVG